MNNSEFNLKYLSHNIKEKVKSDVLILKEENINPRLNTILIGDNRSAHSYACMKKKVGESLGVDVEIDSFGADFSNQEVIEYIESLNKDKNTHGILLESPFPEKFKYGELIKHVDSLKDIDGLHPMNLGSMLERTEDVILPATPLACIAILEKLVDSIQGLRITLVGHGRTVGAPLSDMLNNLGATVVCCNHFTGEENLIKECQNSNVIITATGVANVINEKMVHKDSIIIDAGIIQSIDGIRGDADYDNIVNIANYITPVPGGVGPVTTSIIFSNLIKAIVKQREK